MSFVVLGALLIFTFKAEMAGACKKGIFNTIKRGGGGTTFYETSLEIRLTV